ncbi:diaminopimelate epimerase [Billgrantia sp. Q4P2]|uniref:diaminopimelate epimerase n=1 Tax=Billgrantia sp. Q4P2 TaxID=3463857 RepID=UPI00405733A7
MEFIKYDALGNDYLVLDPASCDLILDPAAIRRICDRHHGLGSDGILYGPLLDNGQYGLRIFNPDGTECEKSGNGLRIFARYLRDAGYVTAETAQVHLMMSDTVVDVAYLGGQDDLIQVAMGHYTLRSSEIPVLLDAPVVLGVKMQVGQHSLTASCVNLGNPHCVVLDLPVTENTARTVGPALCESDLFPERVNVQITRVVDRQTLEIEIWERGAGYTLASGSSSCAAAIACHQLGLVDAEVTVHMPGGTVNVQIDKATGVHLTGPVKAVFAANLSQDLNSYLAKDK